MAYGYLEPGQTHRYATYSNKVWIAREATSECRMNLGLSQVRVQGLGYVNSRLGFRAPTPSECRMNLALSGSGAVQPAVRAVLCQAGLLN